jgi:hypothetical protein
MKRWLLAIGPVDHPGGAEIHPLRLLAGLRSRGWEIMLTTPGDGPLRDAALEAGYRWRALPLGRLKRGGGARAIGSWLAEAMAVGTPVVATRVNGLPEVFDDGVTVRLVAPGDPSDLAKAVLEVLARREEMGAAVRERARRFFVHGYVDRVEQLIAPER